MHFERHFAFQMHKILFFPVNLKKILGFLEIGTCLTSQKILAHTGKIFTRNIKILTCPAA